MGNLDVKKPDATGKQAVTKPAPGQHKNNDALNCLSNKNPIAPVFCALPPSKSGAASQTFAPGQMNFNQIKIDQQIMDKGINDVTVWANGVAKKVIGQANGIASQIQKDIETARTTKPKGYDLSFDTGFTLSLTPGASMEYTLKTCPLDAKPKKPVFIAKPQAVPSAKPAIKPHLTSAEAKKQWADAKTAGFAQRIWANSYSQLAHSIEKIENFTDVKRVISDYCDLTKKPLKVKLGPKAADEFYQAHSAFVETCINGHPSIKDKDTLRRVVYSMFTQESAFKGTALTLTQKVMINGKRVNVIENFKRTVSDLRKKQAAYDKAVEDQKVLPGQIAKLQSDFDEKKQEFSQKFQINSGDNTSIDKKLASFTRDEKKYRLTKQQQALIDNFERQSKIKGAKIKPERIKRVNELKAQQIQDTKFREQVQALQALSSLSKKLADMQKLSASAPKRQLDNTLKPQDQETLSVLGKLYDECKAGIAQHKYKSESQALTKMLEEKLPKIYEQIEANGLLKLNIVGDNAKERLASLGQIKDLTSEQQAQLRANILKIKKDLNENPNLLKVNRQCLQYQIQNLLDKPNRTEAENIRLKNLQQKEDLNITNQYLRAAKGIGQLMDDECYNRRDTSLDTATTRKEINPFDVRQNVFGAINQMAELTEMAENKNLSPEDRIKYIACAYNGGPSAANRNCLEDSDGGKVFVSDVNRQDLADETKIHIRQVSKYANAYQAIFEDAQKRRTNYVEKLVKAQNDVETRTQQTFDKYIQLGQESDRTHKPAPIEPTLRANTWAYWRKRLLGS